MHKHTQTPPLPSRPVLFAQIVGENPFSKDAPASSELGEQTAQRFCLAGARLYPGVGQNEQRPLGSTNLFDFPASLAHFQQQQSALWALFGPSSSICWCLQNTPGHGPELVGGSFLLAPAKPSWEMGRGWKSQQRLWWLKSITLWDTVWILVSCWTISGFVTRTANFLIWFYFLRGRRGDSALTGINCVHGEKGKVLECCSNTRSSWCTFVRHKPPICSLSKKNSGSPWDILFPFSLCLIRCNLVFPTRNPRFCSVWGPKQQHGSSQENRSLLSVSAQVSLIQTTRKMAKQGG